MRINVASIPKPEQQMLIFPWLEHEDPDVHSEAIRWRVGNTSYEFHMKQLSKLDLHIFVPHCDDFITKVLNTVQTAAHQGPSLFNQFPRTLSTILQTEWQQILIDHPVGLTVQEFRDSIRHFVAVHFDAEDQHQLLQQLRRPRKPRNIKVQTFYYSFKRANHMMGYLPGNAQALNADEQRQSFFDSMAFKWQNEFTQIKGPLDQVPMAEVVRFFRNCEKIANQAEENNRAKQRREADANKKRSSSNATTSNSNSRLTGNHNNGKKSKVICPKHPNANHTWAQCYLNPENPEGFAAKAKAKEAAAKNGKKLDGHMAEESLMADLSVQDEEFPLTDASEKELLDVILKDADLVDDVVVLPGLLNELGDGMFTCNDIVTDCYVNAVLSHTALLHSYSAAQRLQRKKNKRMTLRSIYCKSMR